jgi:hypothetical protein
VSWQEDLRRLDEELASGRLSADDYRARRDQVLSSAVTPAAQPTRDNLGDEETATQIIEPVSPPHAVPQPQGQPQPQDSSDATQVVSAADTVGERTQVVPTWQTRPPSPAGGFPQPQQHGPASPRGGFAPPQQEERAWNAPQEDVSPPWGGSEFPPLAPSRSPEWVAQGPETFQTVPSSGKGRKITFSIIGFVVLAGLGFAIWALFVKDGGGTTVADPTTSQQPAPTTTSLPEPPAAKPEPADNNTALITPPGTARVGGGEFDLSALKHNKLLPDSVVQALQQGGMTKGLLKTSTAGGSTIGLFALSLPDPQGAAAVAREYANTQRTGGLPANTGLSMKGVPVFSTPVDTKDAVFRAVYVLYNRVVIVETFGPDRAAVQEQFQQLLNSQVQLAPPTQRGA